MKNEPDLRTILDSGLGDARVHSIDWAGEDLAIVFALNYGPPWPESTRISFKFAANVRIELIYGSFSGAPLVFEARFLSVEPQGWHVRIDFGIAPDGFIEFDCSEISIGNI